MSGQPLRKQPPSPPTRGAPTRPARPDGSTSHAHAAGARTLEAHAGTRAAPSARRPPPRRVPVRPLPAGQALLVMVIAFTLAGLLTGADLRARADGMEPGLRRSAALLGARPLAATSALLRLDRPCGLLVSGAGRAATRSWPQGRPVRARRTGRAIGTTPGTAGVALDASAATTDATTAHDADGTTPAVSRDHPLQVWVGGDSMVERVGEALTNRGDKSGLLDVRTVSKVSSGLCRPDYFDWPGVMADVAATQHPDVSVIQFGGNDYQDLVVDGKEVAPFTPAWTKEYERRVAKVVQTLTADGGRLYWLGLPVMRDQQKNAAPPPSTSCTAGSSRASREPPTSTPGSSCRTPEATTRPTGPTPRERSRRSASPMAST